jgi:hypothetical protein
MLQLVGMVVIIFSVVLGYDSADSWARGDISMKEAVSELRDKVLNLLRDGFEDSANLNSSSKTENFSDTDTAPSPEIYRQDFGPQGGSEPVLQGSDGKTAALARQLLRQSQAGN